MPNIHHNPLHAQFMRNSRSIAVVSGSQNACEPEELAAPPDMIVLSPDVMRHLRHGDYFDDMQEEADQLRVRTKPRHARAQRTDRIR
ncbi:MAG: hypothetical protein WKG03_16430 [Telluria sp.]